MDTIKIDRLAVLNEVQSRELCKMLGLVLVERTWCKSIYISPRGLGTIHLAHSATLGDLLGAVGSLAWWLEGIVPGENFV